MRKKLVSFALAAVASLGMSAKSVVFTLTDGTLVYYLLSRTETSPMMRFVDGGVTVNTDYFAFSQLKNFYISTTDDPNAIEDLDYTYGGNGGKLVFDAAKVINVTVCEVNGTRVNADVQDMDGKLVVDLTGLKSGVYLVNTGGSSFKIIKK